MNDDKMSQAEVDFLVESIMGRGTDEEKEQADKVLRELRKKNYRMLESAIRRNECHRLGNHLTEADRSGRAFSVHYYAHLNWLYNRGFRTKADFRAFMDGAARKKGVTLAW